MRKPHEKASEESSATVPRAGVQRNEAATAEPLRDLQQSTGNQAMLELLGAGVVQRKAKGSESGAAESGPTPAPTPANAKMLIVDDEAKDVGPGQMRKSEFLSQLRTEVCSTAEDALRGTMWSSMGCPYIEKWLGHYGNQPSSHLERALRKYAPETASASTAREYIPLVTRRVRRGIEEWRSTGEVKDLPEEFAAGGMPGATVSGLMGGLLSAAGGAISGLVGGAGKALSSLGSMLFKHRDGVEAGGEADPEAVRSQLGTGQALDSSVQRRMQSAFGQDFAGVRVHTDAKARELSDGMNARAFTIGNDIAFGGEEYKPGTPVGDALIAHELAHVVQQGAGHSSGPMNKAPGQSEQLEEDADLSAMGAVVSMWTSAKDGLAGIGEKAIPRLRSGLRLQRCEKSERQKEIERLGGLQYGHMEQKRKDEEARLKKEAEKEAKEKGLPPPKTEPKVEMEDIVKKEQEKHAIKGGATKEWDDADQPAWRAKADKVWKDVVASVKGTELEAIAKGVTFKFDPETALKEGYYAWQTGHTLNVGMSWVRFAEKDPKNAWENLAHEMGGHLKYDKTYAAAIMKAALSHLSDAERKKVKGDPQNFFETYEYPETEIYSSLWQRRYRVPLEGPAPESGGIHPDTNIDIRLKTMKEVLHPEVALAVLRELKRRVDENDQILQRDKDFFVKKVEEIFKVKL
jgi:hypothetical protein